MMVVVVGRVDELQEAEAPPPADGKATTGRSDPRSATAHIMDPPHDKDDDTDGGDDDTDGGESSRSDVVDSDFPSSAGCLFSAPKDYEPQLDATSHSESSQSQSSDDVLVLLPPRSANKSRRVRFATDGNDCVVHQVFRYRAVSERRKDLCYMSKAELSEAVDSANQFAKSYASLHDDWHGTVETLLLSSGASVSDDEENSRSNVDADADDDDKEAILILTESSARGLEFSSRLLQKHQEWANKSVLRRYHQLRAQADGNKDKSDPMSGVAVAELLRERCERVNRFTRRLAIQLARGDAIQARTVYEQDGTWARWKDAWGEGVRGEGTLQFA